MSLYDIWKSTTLLSLNGTLGVHSVLQTTESTVSFKPLPCLCKTMYYALSKVVGQRNY